MLRRDEYEINPADYDLLEDADDYSDELEPTRFWTWSRLLFAALALLMLAAFMFYIFAPVWELFVNPPPTPPPINVPGQRA
jgi:hypothetical protein